jgi:hypothetical protein
MVIELAVVPPGPGRHSRRTVSPHPQRAGSAERAVIGDHLREPAAWCELSPCIARYADAEALGQADVVARAIAAGWCKDLFGRLICPACQQRLPVWSAAPLVSYGRTGR